MSNVAKCNWRGASGAVYSYEIHPIGTPFNNVAGNYIFAKQGKPGIWHPVYIGEAESLGNRCAPTHEKWERAIRNGATHIHAKVTVGGKLARCMEETDLRRNFTTPCNDQ